MKSGKLGMIPLMRLLAILLLTGSVWAENTIQLKSGIYSFEKREQLLKKTHMNETLLMMVKLSDKSAVNSLINEGVNVLRYMGNSVYMVKLNQSFVSGKMAEESISGYLPVTPEMKISPHLKMGMLSVSVYPFNKTVHKNLTAFFKTSDIEFEYKDGFYNCVLNNPEQLRTVASLNEVEWVDIREPEMKVENIEAQAMSNIDDVQDAPFNLSGVGEKVGIWDGGEVFQHREFGDRLHLNEHSSVSSHATHVSGTIGSSGLYDARSEGMAPGVDIFSYNYSSAVTELGPAYQQFGIQISNHSWGWDHSSNSFDPETFGDYSAYSAFQDDVIFENNLLVVRSAGNSRGDFDDTQTIDTTSTSKNIIAVGALWRDKEMTYYSSWGPCDDGRIKPDVCAKGGQTGIWRDGQYSTLPGDTYGEYQGTSMASPVVAGSMALISEFYHRYSQDEIPAAYAKGLLIHTVEDLGNVGPEYSYGWGLIDLQDAIEFLSLSDLTGINITSAFFVYMSDQQTNEYEFELTQSEITKLNDGALRVTASWMDEAGSASAQKALVNDIDIKLVSPTGVEYYPFILDVNNPDNPAETGVNSVDNIEKIVVDSPESGTWKLIVTGSDINPMSEPEVYIFADAHIPVAKISEPLAVVVSPVPDLNYEKFAVIKGHTGETLNFSGFAYDDDGYVNEYQWNYTNINLPTDVLNPGNFTIPDSANMFTFTFKAKDEQGNSSRNPKTHYIMKENVDGYTELPPTKLTAQTVAFGQVRKYFVDLPVGVENPVIYTQGLSDVDIFVSYLNSPDISYNTNTDEYEFSYEHPYMYMSAGADGNEQINLPSPLNTGGAWCVQVYGWAAGSSFFSIGYTVGNPAVTQPDTEIISPSEAAVSVPQGSVISFEAVGSGDLAVTDYTWKLDSTDQGNGNITQISFPTAGTFTVSAAAVDESSNTDTSPDVVTVTVFDPEDYPYDLFCPMVYQNTVYDTDIHLVNSTESPASVILLALDYNGSVTQSYTINALSKGEKTVLNLADMFPSTMFVSGVRVYSSKDINGFVHVKSKSIYPKEAAAVLNKTSETMVYIPHIHEISPTETFWGTSYGLMSDGAPDISFDTFSEKVEALNSTLNPLVKKERFITLFDGEMPASPMWGAFESENASGFAGMEMFETVSNYNQMAMLTLSGDTFTTLYIAHTDITWKWWTGLSLNNINPSAVDITITGYDAEGTQLASYPLHLEGGERKVAEIQYFFENDQVSTDLAWVKIEATAPVKGFELFGILTGDFDQIAGLDAIGNLSSRLMFMHVTKVDKGYTGIAILNPGDTAVNVNINGYNSDGQLVGSTVTKTINPRQKFVDITSNIFPDDSQIDYVTVETEDGSYSICGFELFGTVDFNYLNGVEAVEF